MPQREEQRVEYSRLTGKELAVLRVLPCFVHKLKRSMHKMHRASEKPFIDFASPTITLISGGCAHNFVTSLGASSYRFA
jgi:hypothetical protein